MGLLDRIAYEARLAAQEVRNKVVADFWGGPAQANPRNRVYGYRSPNAMPDTTPAQPAQKPNLQGLPLDQWASVVLQSNPAILNVNFGFETGVSPWAPANSATLTQSNVWSYQGSNSALFTGNGVASNPLITSENTIPVTGGAQYTASAECYSPQGFATTQVGINWYTSAHGYISTSSGVSSNVPANVLAGTPVTVTANAPSNAAFAQMFIEMNGLPASTVLMYVDLAQVNPGATPSNSLGSGTCQLGPSIVREQWQPQSASVSVATNVNEAACSLFLGSSPQNSTSLGQTSKGSTGSTAALGQNMVGGYLLIAVWSGGDPGSLATLRVIGTRSIGSPS
jgi:hypothetical protein